MILRLSCCTLIGLAAAVFGCGGDNKPTVSMKAARSSFAEAPAASDQAFRFAAPQAEGDKQPRQDFLAREGDAPAPSAKPAQAIDQKIIYTGTLSVVAKSFDEAEPKVREIVKRHNAYIADAQVQRNQGSQPSATWVVRTPAEKFDDCMHDLAALGVPESQRVTTQDVGEEYVDVQSRIAAKKKVEERVLEMLKDRKGDLREVMELETKLSGIREEIERAQGRLNFLTNRVSYSTINLTLREVRDYVPPQTPDFAGQVSDAWKTSSGSFTRFAQGVALFGISIAPWLPVWAIVILVLWFAAKRIHRAAVQPRPTA
jgi:hypothetical protein